MYDNRCLSPRVRDSIVLVILFALIDRFGTQLKLLLYTLIFGLGLGLYELLRLSFDKLGLENWLERWLERRGGFIRI